MYTPKVGDTVTHQSGASGEVMALFDGQVAVKVTSCHVHNLQVWTVQNLLPPSPTVVFEGWVNVYRHGLAGIDLPAAYFSRSQYEADVSASKDRTGLLHIAELSDGTWKIEKVA